MKKVYKMLLTIILTITFIGSANAGSAKFNVSSSANQVIVGNDVTVTVTISSASPIGSWEYTLNYDKNIFKLTSSGVGLHYAGYASNGNTKSVSYKYTFKALKSGSGNFYVDSSAVVGWDETIFSASNGNKSVKAISYAEYQATLSKNNNLKGITVNGNSVSEEFLPDVLEYSITVNEDVTKVNIEATKADSTATVNGTGEFEVEAGSNAFEIVVVAQNGSEKTYKLIVEVLDKTPINVNVDGKEYTVVKLAKNLNKPESYEETTINISGIDVPAFYSEITDFTLVGLKDNESNISLFIYSNDKYKPYYEITSGSLTIYPLEIDREVYKFKKQKLTIDNMNIDALSSDGKRYFLIKGINVETKEEGLYLYDNVDKTLIKYNEDYLNDIFKTNIILLIVTGIFGLTTLISLIIIFKLSQKKKKKIKVEKVKIEEKQDFWEDDNKITEVKKESKKNAKKVERVGRVK